MFWVGWMLRKEVGLGDYVRVSESSWLEGFELVWQLLKWGGEDRFQEYYRGFICEIDLLIGLYCSDTVGLFFNLQR